MKPLPQSRLAHIQRPSGEALVWMTSVGLTVGLLMVAGLLTLIVYQGAQSFWPRRMVEIRIKGESPFKFRDGKIIAGEIVKQNKKIIHEVAQRRAAAREHRDLEQWQLYIGNKDLFGANFVYIDHESVAEQ